MPELTDVQAIIDTAQASAVPDLIPVDDGQRLYSVIVPQGGEHRIIDVEKILGPYRDTPRRKTGNYWFTDPDSLVAYLDKHGADATEIYADVDKGTITAVIDAHGEAPGWGEHRAILTLRKTDDWAQWTKADGQWASQSSFAEFVEQHLPNFVTPEGAIMLELAQSFKATKSVKFEQSKRLKSGETKLEWREDVEAKAGSRGSLDIPDEITLALQPFEHGAPYKVTARLRYRIDDGHLALSYVLIRPRDVLLDAFNAVCTDVSAASSREIWHGTTG